MTTEQKTPDLPAVGVPVDWRVGPHRATTFVVFRVSQSGAILERNMNQSESLEWMKQKLDAANEGDAVLEITGEGGVAYTLAARGGEKYPESLRCEISAWPGGEMAAALMKTMELLFADQVIEQRQYAMGTHSDLMDKDGAQE